MAAVEPRGSSYYAAPTTCEHRRLQDAEQRLRGADWKNIGPYVVDREWGLPREDYTPDGDAWAGFPHDQARSRAYRWAEDGIAGVCNRFQNWVMALTLWNGKDPILKERFFGLAGPEGNHGEDAKEIWAHEDATPCSTWLRLRYIYPMQEYPYAKLADMSRARSRLEREPELPEALEGGLASLEEGNFWDVAVEYGKASADEILMRVRARSMRPASLGAAGTATIHILPSLWFRNTWSWGYDSRRPALRPIRRPATDDAATAPPAPFLGDAAFTGYASGSPSAPWRRACGEEDAEIRVVGWERHVGGMRWAVSVPEHRKPEGDAEPSTSPSPSPQSSSAPAPAPSASPVAMPDFGPVPAAASTDSSTVDPMPSTSDAKGPHPSPRARLVQPVEALVTDNDTNYVRVFGEAAKAAQPSPHTKDAFHDHVIGSTEASRGRVKPAGDSGTKAAAWVVLEVPAGCTGEVWCRLRIEGRRLRGENCTGDRTRSAAAYAQRAVLATNMGVNTAELALGATQAQPFAAEAEDDATASESSSQADASTQQSSGLAHAPMSGSMMFAERSLSSSLVSGEHGETGQQDLSEADALQGMDAGALDDIFDSPGDDGSDSDGHSSAGDAPMFAYSSIRTSPSLEGLALDPLSELESAMAMTSTSMSIAATTEAAAAAAAATAANNAANNNATTGLELGSDAVTTPDSPAKTPAAPQQPHPHETGSPQMRPAPAPSSAATASPGYLPTVAVLDALPLPESSGSAGEELVPAHDKLRDGALDALEAAELQAWSGGNKDTGAGAGAGGWRPWDNFAAVMEQRRMEADRFYAALQPPGLAEEDRRIQRQAFSGLVWTKGFYHFGVSMWLDGDPAFSPPPGSRKEIRNASWRHLYVASVVSLPDKWEYSFFAVWDLAFHMIPMSIIDPEWSKRQLLLFMREWIMHGSGSMPAYEWNFDDANPPVHAWACLRVFQITRRASGVADTGFLERAFHKLLLNFQFWTNRVDPDGRNLFGGGFLGLDNISPINRSEVSSTPGLEDVRLLQADGTAWMAFYCATMLSIALELAAHNPSYEDVANKFLEHFVVIAHACDDLWHDADGFYYDWARPNHGHGTPFPIRVRSYVGLIPLFANIVIPDSTLRKLPSFRARMAWFVRHRSEWCSEHVYTTRSAQAPVVGISVSESAADLVRAGFAVKSAASPASSSASPAGALPSGPAPPAAASTPDAPPPLSRRPSWMQESVASFEAKFGSQHGSSAPLPQHHGTPQKPKAPKASSKAAPAKEGLHLLTLVSPARLKRIMERVLDEEQFLSPYGVRSLSKEHKDKPYTLKHNSFESTIEYTPGDSTSPMFGGNSNWRGCTWFPINHLLIESLQRYDYFFGDDFHIDHRPLHTDTPRAMNLWDVSSDLSNRLIDLFRSRSPQPEASRSPGPASRGEGAAAPAAAETAAPAAAETAETAETDSATPKRPAPSVSSLDELLGLPADAVETERPAYGDVSPWMDRLGCLKELHQFFEFFDGDTGAGLGASHQTGWTALVAKLVQQQASTRRATARR